MLPAMPLQLPDEILGHTLVDDPRSDDDPRRGDQPDPSLSGGSLFGSLGQPTLLHLDTCSVASNSPMLGPISSLLHGSGLGTIDGLIEGRGTPNSAAATDSGGLDSLFAFLDRDAAAVPSASSSNANAGDGGGGGGGSLLGKDRAAAGSMGEGGPGEGALGGSILAAARGEHASTSSSASPSCGAPSSVLHPSSKRRRFSRDLAVPERVPAHRGASPDFTALAAVEGADGAGGDGGSSCGDGCGISVVSSSVSSSASASSSTSSSAVLMRRGSGAVDGGGSGDGSSGSSSSNGSTASDTQSARQSSGDSTLSDVEGLLTRHVLASHSSSRPRSDISSSEPTADMEELDEGMAIGGGGGGVVLKDGLDHIAVRAQRRKRTCGDAFG